MIVLNSKRRDSQSKSIQYCEILLRMMRSQNSRSNDIFEMMKIQLWINKEIENQRTLENNQMYDMTAIQRSVHVIFNEKKDYYVNNYVNWDSYNTIYNFNFLKIDVRRAKTFDEDLRWCHILMMKFDWSSNSMSSECSIDLVYCCEFVVNCETSAMSCWFWWFIYKTSILDQLELSTFIDHWRIENEEDNKKWFIESLQMN